MSLKLASSIAAVKGVGDAYHSILAGQCIVTVADLLLQFPQYYIDLSQINPVVQLDETLTYSVDVDRHSLSRNYPKRRSLLKIGGRIGERPVEIIFFNTPYLRGTLKKVNRILIRAVFRDKDGLAQAINPIIFPESLQGRIVPVYRPISTIKPGTVRRLVQAALGSLADPTENLPESLVRKHGFGSRAETFRHVHFPDILEPERIERMKKRFIYSEFLLFQLELQYIRQRFKSVKRVYEYPITERVKKRIEDSLPFSLTGDQIRVFTDIVNDLHGPTTMNRLLQGDVGSGKTIVAFMALLLAVESGYQGVFLAPTEILANQHFEKAREFFSQERVCLISGSTPPAEKRNIIRQLADGSIRVAFGTHALLNQNILFHKLTMVVIDEQHRFGVSQRASLYYKGHAVDLLVTTATPIPRTLLLTLFDDLSVSVIKEKPRGRKPIKTTIVRNNGRDIFYDKIKNNLGKLGRIFIILPLIERSEYFPSFLAIKDETPHFKKLFAPHRLGVLTGRSPAESKERMLRHFREGSIKVLLSTTVVEVGIDIRQADVVIIENADNYGLAQLHQLRGRVGRGDRQSYCFLIQSQSTTESGRRRLETIAATQDGFKIAEVDLQMRGGGLISGIEQSGELDFKVGHIKRDYGVFREAQVDAIRLLKQPELQNTWVRKHLGKLKMKVKKISFS